MRCKKMLVSGLLQVFFAAWLVCSFAAVVCRGDIFTFKDGRVIAGRVTNVGEKGGGDQGKPEKVWTVEIEPGAFIQIYQSNLARGGHIVPQDREKEYVARLSAIEDTAEAHFELARWCIGDRVGLRDLAAAHYLRVLDLDPNHEAARAACGFRKDSDGRWVKKAKLMEEQRGQVLYKGEWWFPEELAIAKAEEEREVGFVAVTKNIPRWHAEAAGGSSRRSAAAIAELEKLDDPRCIELLTKILQGKQKPLASPELRTFYLGILSRLESPEATRVAAHVSITDEVEAVRNAAMNSLQERYLPAAQAVYLGYLRNEKNLLVNRAADALSQIGTDGLILPLIESLVTEHTQTVGGGPTTYGADAMTFAGKQKVQKVRINNQSVLGTLTAVTGQNFEYNQAAWTAWYASVYAPPAADLRRDP